MLSMKDVVNYCGDHNRHSFVEGSTILKNGFLIECTIEKKRNDIIDIFAKCFQTSDQSSHPHEISIQLKKKVSIIMRVRDVWHLQMPQIMF